MRRLALHCNLQGKVFWRLCEMLGTSHLNVPRLGWDLVCGRKAWTSGHKNVVYISIYIYICSYIMIW